MPKVLLAEMCRADLKKRKFDVAVLPIGSCEVHALHLPFATDAYLAGEISRRAAERAAARGTKVVVLPTIPFGCDQNLLAFPCTVSIQPTTVLRLFDDLIGSLAGHGLRKFLVVNGHGGNIGTLEAVSRELYGKYGAFIARLGTWCVAEDVITQVQETTEIEHADEIETSIALALVPELVNMKAAQRTRTNRTRLALLQKYGGQFCRPWHLFTNNGGVGDPTKATREKGEKIVEATVERMSRIIAELAEAKMDKRFPY